MMTPVRRTTGDTQQEANPRESAALWQQRRGKTLRGRYSVWGYEINTTNTQSTARYRLCYWGRSIRPEHLQWQLKINKQTIKQTRVGCRYFSGLFDCSVEVVISRRSLGDPLLSTFLNNLESVIIWNKESTLCWWCVCWVTKCSTFWCSNFVWDAPGGGANRPTPDRRASVFFHQSSMEFPEIK